MVDHEDGLPFREQRLEPVAGVLDRPVLGVLCQKLGEVVVRKGFAGGHDANGKYLGIGFSIYCGGGPCQGLKSSSGQLRPRKIRAVSVKMIVM